MSDGLERGWDALVGDLYLSATDERAAARLPAALARFVGGAYVALWRSEPLSGSVADRMLTDMPADAGALYAAHYYKLDPWRAPILRAPPNTVVHGAQLIEDAALARSAYHNEFGARFDTFHMISTVLPLSPDPTQPIGAFSVFRSRASGAFGGEQANRFARLLPHVRRALQLRAQVANVGAATRAAVLDAMLEGLGVAAAVLDGHGRVLHANAAAERLDAARTGLALRGGAPGRTIAAATADETRRLHAAVAAAAQGGAGGALRLRLRSGAALFAVVSPLPSILATPERAGQGWALLVLRPLDHPPADALQRLGIELFGFTPAEAEAAAALCGGLSPSGIAAARQVRVSTVRTLLQRAQDKADAKCLRGLVATLAALRG